MKIKNLALFLPLLTMACKPSDLLKSQEESQFKSFSHEEMEDAWKRYLTKPQPNKDELRKHFLAAAEEFKVPAELLMAIGQVETNWTQIGPGVDYGWGIMHLVENPYIDTLGLAAKLIGATRESLKNDPKQNIRGAAALLADVAGVKKSSFKKLEDWFPAAMVLSGLATNDLRFQQAKRYFATMQQGVESPTFFGDKVVIESNPEINLPAEKEADAIAPDYPAGEARLTSCNHSKGRKGIKIDTYVNHWIGVGTFAGSISWFHNCKRESGSSAHFIVSKDGKVAQVVRVEDTAWHSGSKTVKDNKERSIGVEHEVTTTHPETWNSTVLLKASTDLARHLTTKYNIPKVQRVKTDDPKASGIRGHSDMPGTSTACPGPLPWASWMAMLNGGNAPAETAETGTLLGVTYEGADTKKRVAGVKVTLSTGEVVVSSANGSYEFKNVKPGSYKVKAEKEGYKTSERDVTVKANQQNWGSVSLSK